MQWKPSGFKPAVDSAGPSHERIPPPAQGVCCESFLQRPRALVSHSTQAWDACGLYISSVRPFQPTHFLWEETQNPSARTGKKKALAASLHTEASHVCFTGASGSSRRAPRASQGHKFKSKGENDFQWELQVKPYITLEMSLMWTIHKV